MPKYIHPQTDKKKNLDQEKKEKKDPRHVIPSIVITKPNQVEIKKEEVKKNCNCQKYS